MRDNRVTRTLNVEVERQSDPKYGEGLDQGVKFAGIEGYWKISTKADIYNSAKLRAAWPPPECAAFRVTLTAKPASRADCYYRDITELSKATGPAETWDWKGDLAGATGGGADSSGQGGGDAPWGGSPATGAGGAAGTVDARARSIERQVVVKAMAEVLAASVGVIAAGAELKWQVKLAARFEARCDELWGEPEPAADADEDGGQPEGEPEPEDPGELDPDDLPF